MTYPLHSAQLSGPEINRLSKTGAGRGVIQILEILAETLFKIISSLMSPFEGD
jgi:hypothetical protein